MPQSDLSFILQAIFNKFEVWQGKNENSSRQAATDRRENRPKLFSTGTKDRGRETERESFLQIEILKVLATATASCATGATITGSSGIPCRREPRLVFELET